MSRSNLRWVPWLLLAAVLLGAAYGFAGYMMAGSFATSNPKQLAHWQKVSTIYGGVVIGCLVSAAAVSLYLIRARQRSPSPPV